MRHGRLPPVSDTQAQAVMLNGTHHCPGAPIRHAAVIVTPGGIRKRPVAPVEPSVTHTHTQHGTVSRHELLRHAAARMYFHADGHARMILPDGRHKPLRLKVPLQVSGISVELQTGQRNRLIGRKWLLLASHEQWRILHFLQYGRDGIGCAAGICRPLVKARHAGF